VQLQGDFPTTKPLPRFFASFLFLSGPRKALASPPFPPLQSNPLFCRLPFRGDFYSSTAGRHPSTTRQRPPQTNPFPPFALSFQTLFFSRGILAPRLKFSQTCLPSMRFGWCVGPELFAVSPAQITLFARYQRATPRSPSVFCFAGPLPR